jgi:SAM-dependent methyltransferase
MPFEDAERWNARYSQEGSRYSRFLQPRPFLVRCAPYLPEAGFALDAAMGLGGNAGFLLERGLRVVGVDISSAALRQARQRLPRLEAVLADLTSFFLPPASFDVILNFYYLQRDLWAQYASALRPGGVLIFETLTTGMQAHLPKVDPAYLLAPGELRSAFPTLELLQYEEGWKVSDSGHPKAIASLAARKLAS